MFNHSIFKIIVHPRITAALQNERLADLYNIFPIYFHHQLTSHKYAHLHHLFTTISLSPITLCGPSQVADSKPFLPSYLNFEPSILCKARKHLLGLLESIHLPLLPLGFCYFLQNNFIQVYDLLHSTHHL